MGDSLKKYEFSLNVTVISTPFHAKSLYADLIDRLEIDDAVTEIDASGIKEIK